MEHLGAIELTAHMVKIGNDLQQVLELPGLLSDNEAKEITTYGTENK
jgi:hypothetical protein